ncbi:MAG: homoserine dehydrogenase [Alphaproteobacteria bacterium]
MDKPFRIAIAGLGTVGVGVIKILTQHASVIAQRAGRPIEIVAVSARSKKDRGVDLSGFEWVDNTADLANYPEIDAVIELIGGSEGIAKDLVFNAVENKRHIVTANKALVAHHGIELATLSEKNSVSVAYEAAVAGGIPIIKAMREGFSANEFKAVYGILNGTCNYILTQMRETGREFSDVLNDAQELGYAEADPTFDIEGIDAAHKLCILTSIAFGTKPDFDAMDIEGITKVTAEDIGYATEFGYRIKLLGIARNVDGKVIQMVKPCLVPASSALGLIEDVFNAVYVEADYVDTPLLTGRGAGEGPTASSVVADIIDLARGIEVPTFGVAAEDLKLAQWLDLKETSSRYYLRLNVKDQMGAISDISTILKDYDISIEAMVQHGGSEPGEKVHVVITTHEAAHSDILNALEKIKGLPETVEEPCLMRIEEI